MKKIFVFLLAVTLMLEQTNITKVSAEPTELCSKLIHYLDYDCIGEDVSDTIFSMEDLENEIENYNENDFDDDDRYFASEAMNAYSAALQVLQNAMHRELPEEILGAIVLEDSSDNSLYSNQREVFENYLLNEISDNTKDICTHNCDNPTFDANFFEENKEIVARFISLHLATENALYGHNRFDDYDVGSVLVFLARAFFKGYEGETRFFRIYSNYKDNMICIDLYRYCDNEYGNIDSFDFNI